MTAAVVSDNRVKADHSEKIHTALRNLMDCEYATVGGAAISFSFCDSVTVPTTSLDDVADVYRLYQFPPGAVLRDFAGTPSDADTNATPTLVYSVLVLDSAGTTIATLVLSSTNGQAAAGTDSILASAKYKFVGGYYLAIKIGTVAATPAAMTYKFGITYSLGFLTFNESEVSMVSIGI